MSLKPIRKESLSKNMVKFKSERNPSVVITTKVVRKSTENGRKTTNTLGGL